MCLKRKIGGMFRNETRKTNEGRKKKNGKLKKQGKRMKSIMKMQKTENKRNNINSISSNNNNTNNFSNSKYKRSIWRRRINKKSRTSKRNTYRGTSKRKARIKIRRI